MNKQLPTADIILNEWTFKSDHMRQMAVDVCKLALARGVAGEFSAIDLAHRGADEHGGQGIAGSIFRQLVGYGIISPVGTFLEGEFIQRRVRNACGNPIGLWRLANPGLAHALLRAHGAKMEKPIQQEMAFT